ncbi:MAG: hypothetical protein HKP30_05080, partial [Myxococcales bacterium]|nr:hypothetical protein [Myxococcales bacterium]
MQQAEDMFRWSHDLQLDRPTFILRAPGARRRLRLLVIGLLVSWGGPAAALSTVSIDVDPMASDRQVEKIVRVGETFEVDILIQEDAA